MTADAIELGGVGKSFGATVALSDVDLTVASGGFVTLLGPSGCGKTTLLRIIAGLESPTTGSVRFGAASPGELRRAKQIGWVPQSPALLPWRTVRANARLLRDVNAAANPADLPDPDELLAEVGLGEFCDAHPHELSGGMQQRVALVRAFALGAPYLLMDEPFAALDEITRVAMRHLLLRLRATVGSNRATVVFVTHSIGEAVYLSDRVIVFSPRPGRIVADLAIDLPWPRTPAIEDSPEFFAHESALRHALYQGAG